VTRAPGVARWAVVTTFALSLIGLAISGYLTFTHFRGVQYLACGDRGVVNCAAVTTSRESYFLGVPVAVLGLAHYVAMSVITTPLAWRARAPWVDFVRIALAAIGMAFVLWLLAAELLIIDHICLWCTAVHVVTFLLLVVLSRVSPARLGWTQPRTNDRRSSSLSPPQTP
jgi:uncharacterized membrane protein